MIEKLVELAAAKLKMLAVIAAATAVGGTGAAITVSNVSHEATDSAVASEIEQTAGPEPTPTATDDETESEDGEKARTTTATAPITLPTCTGEERNHGEYVSRVARGDDGEDADEADAEDADEADTEGTETEGSDDAAAPRNHGALVSAAAKSDCGKKGSQDGDDSEQTPKPAKTKAEKAKHGHGKGHGKGHGGPDDSADDSDD